MGKVFASVVVAPFLAIAALGACAKFVSDPLSDVVVKGLAFIVLILPPVLGISFLTDVLGPSNTLGAFVSGMILGSLQHKDKIEAEVSLFRGDRVPRRPGHVPRARHPGPQDGDRRGTVPALRRSMIKRT